VNEGAVNNSTPKADAAKTWGICNHIKGETFHPKYRGNQEISGRDQACGR